MILTPAAIALANKIKDERANKKDAAERRERARIGKSLTTALPSPGSSTVASKDSSPSLSLDGNGRHELPSATVNLPNAVRQNEPVSHPTVPALRTDDRFQLGAMSPVPQTQDVAHVHAPSIHTTTPIMSATGSLVDPFLAAETNQSATNPLPPEDASPRIAPKSPDAASSLSSLPCDRSASSSSVTNSDSTIRSGTDTEGTVRVHTNGAGLQSGFPYHPGLFDLKVRPDQWEAFTAEIADSTKFEGRDHAQMWAAATATALTGAWVTSVWVGRTMRRTIEEKKVKAGLGNTAIGGLGEVLQHWNETVFRPLGLVVLFELSESALKHPDHKSATVRRSALLYSKREDRERKREERKFCIVVTRLTDNGNLPEDIRYELSDETKLVEAVGGADAVPYQMVELPANDIKVPVELPAEISICNNDTKTTNLPVGYTELP